MKQYIYIENNQVVVNPKLIPDSSDYVDAEQMPDSSFVGGYDGEGYQADMELWQRNYKPVENVGYIKKESGKMMRGVRLSKKSPIVMSIFSGQLCETTETEPYIVTKIY